MTIPFLDALLPPTAAKLAPNSVGTAASGAFEALLAGLYASVATLPGDQPVAAPGTALPPTGKTLPEGNGPVANGEIAIGPIKDSQIPDGQIADGRFAGIAFDRLSDELGDEAGLCEAVENIPSAPVPAPDAIVLAPVATLASPVATLTHALPASPVAAARADAPAPAPQNSAEPASAERPTGFPARRIVAGELLAPQIGFATPVAPLAPEPRASAVQPAPPAADAPKPAQPLAPSLAILPTGAQPALPGAASPSLRRGHESKLATISLTAALSVTPETSSAAIVAAPAAVLAAPIAVAAGTSAPDAATTPVQPAASPIALPDHRALVEALMRARSERDPGVSVALDTREFGAVALRFEALQSATGERGLQVAFSSGDPGFERAVASAAAAQAALADQSGRNSANRADPAPIRAGENYGDGPGARASSSDPQAQQRGAPDGGWRDTRSRQSAGSLARGEDLPTTAPRPDRRRGSIFA